MVSSEYIQNLSFKSSFSRQDIFRAFRDSGCSVGEEALKKRMQKLLNNGEIVRIGRNAYCIPAEGVTRYDYDYSAFSCEIAKLVREKYPYLDFTIFELVQLNEFVNHQLAHNVIFVSVENDAIDFAFDTLKEAYPGRVLISPTVEVFHQYWTDNMIVIIKMVTETPMGQRQRWHTRIEKLLVDLVSEPLLQETVSVSEYPAIFEDAFAHYAIDENCLFRYAKRRTAEKRLDNFIREKTNIVLRTKR